MLQIAALLMLQAVPAAEAAPKTPPAAAADKKICRSASDIGSLVPKKTCHTRAEWQAIGEGEAKRTRLEDRSLDAPAAAGTAPG